ncbi:MAG: Hsp70 family protein [Myxococcota bacterium]
MAAPPAKKPENLRPTDPVIGIDLGMTSIVAAHVSAAGQPPEVIPAERGQASLPAVVGFKPGKGAVVGRAAQEMLTTAPAQTVSGIKRLLGRKFSSQAVRDLSQRVGFKIVEGEGGDALIEIEGRRMNPSEVAGVLLAQMKQFAEQHLKQPVTNAVIAVPAYFQDTQKAAVRDAAKRAGLEVLKLVHEPTAVALAYSYSKADVRILIIDMGGIRVDVSVMEITGNVFDVVATGGDAYLGGYVLDARIAEWILTNIKKKFGKDLTTNPALLTKVRTAAEQAKRELSKFRAVDLQIPLQVVPKGQKSEIGALRFGQDVLEGLAGDWADRVVSLATHVVQERGLAPSDVDDVVMVGGATRMPLLMARVAKAFGKEPRATLPPEQVIALGAALLGDSLRREAAIEVVKEPIGIALSDGRFMKIIDKDSKLPITRRVMIPTHRDNQRALEVDIFQGDHEDILNTDYLATVVYQGISEAKAGEAKVTVDLALGADRVLTITSPDPGRGKESFQIPTKGSRQLEAARKIEPIFSVAKNVPEAAAP